jgi:prevent-host-death family protein
MRRVSIAEAKAHLSELIDQARAGEDIEITRRGEPVATIRPTERPFEKADLGWLKEATLSMPMQQEAAGDFIRRMRDDERY